MGARVVRTRARATVATVLVLRQAVHLTTMVVPRVAPKTPSVRLVGPTAIRAMLDAGTTPTDGPRPVATTVGAVVARVGAIEVTSPPPGLPCVPRARAPTVLPAAPTVVPSPTWLPTPKKTPPARVPSPQVPSPSGVPTPKAPQAIH